ncbi:MAG: hypothetical protein VX005_06520 [Pseudomonadota bacterium]|nr:hypothetical protein [Pseudomonadota bacterium]
MFFGLKSLYAFFTDLFSGGDDPVRAATEAASTPEADFVTSLTPPIAAESAAADDPQPEDDDEGLADDDDEDDEDEEEDKDEDEDADDDDADAAVEAAVQLALSDAALAELDLLFPSSAPALATAVPTTDASAHDGLGSGLLAEGDDGSLL